DNGMILHCTKLLANQMSSDHIALLLDQEKAYDRIHPTYLQAVMQRFNIPSSITHSLLTLLFSTEIHININGHVSKDHIIQHRGIRQGDPISPLLFNIAFDPFLRSIHQDFNFQGFEMPTATNPTASDVSEESLPQLFTEVIPSPPPPSLRQPTPPSIPTAVKILAYAD
ncbi:hypothetical protein, partial, partial [Parasitella parasitica]